MIEEDHVLMGRTQVKVFNGATPVLDVTALPPRRTIRHLTDRERRSPTSSRLPEISLRSGCHSIRLCAAIVDRLTFDEHIIEAGSECYRLKTTRQKRQKAA